MERYIHNRFSASKQNLPLESKVITTTQRRVMEAQPNKEFFNYATTMLFAFAKRSFSAAAAAASIFANCASFHFGM